jgi:hypothetical protein
MSDLTPHSRDDLDFLPCDCEPPVQPQPYVSYLLTLPPRSLSQAVTDVSRYRDLEPWVWDLLRPARDNVVSLAARRVRRAAQ